MFKPKPKNTSKIVDDIADVFEAPVEKKIKIEKAELVEDNKQVQQKFETIQNIIEKPYQAKLTINQQYKEEEIPQQVISKKKGLSIPQRMPASYKFACTFDYNPSLCKDYHDTGYCTFGDSCIYIHDRGDYKAGWEIEKEYQEEQRRKLMRQDVQEDEFQQKLQEYDIPVDCSICLQKLSNPISTKCQHIFCEKCIKYKKKCPSCQKATNGQFTNAAPLIKEMIERREKFLQQHKQ